jgi:hypothetical protein
MIIAIIEEGRYFRATEESSFSICILLYSIPLCLMQVFAGYGRCADEEFELVEVFSTIQWCGSCVLVVAWPISSLAVQ